MRLAGELADDLAEPLLDEAVHVLDVELEVGGVVLRLRQHLVEAAVERRRRPPARIAPQRPSARTHARDAAISSRTRRRSNGNDRLNSQKAASGAAS